MLNNRENVHAETSAVSAEFGVPSIPRIDNIHQKLYAAVSQPQALDMRDWHTCETTHCRAGWITTLAGAAGKALEEFHNPELAAMINPARFYDSNDVALADIKRLAEEEAGKAVHS